MIFLPSLKQSCFVSLEASFSIPVSESAHLRAKKEKHLRGLDSESFAGEKYFLSLDIELRDELIVKLTMESSESLEYAVMDPNDEDRLTALAIQEHIKSLFGRELDIQ